MNFWRSGGADRFRDRGPSLDAVEASFQRLAESARARLREGSGDEDKRVRDYDTIGRWVRAEGVDLSASAERAREKLEGVNRA
jgi:hypothetical protein